MRQSPQREVKRHGFVKTTIRVIFHIVFRIVAVITMVCGSLMLLGLPVGIYGIWKVVKSGQGNFFDVPEHSLVVLFIVVPLVLLAISTVFNVLAEILLPVTSEVGNGNAFKQEERKCCKK